MKKPLFILLLVAIVLSIAGAPQVTAAATQEDLTVFAAASLTESFKEIGKQFEAKNPNTKVVINFAGSQQLAQQLANAAPADVFASASKKYMTEAVKSGRVEKDGAKIFAKNQLVVIYPKENPAGMKELIDLTKSGLKLVLAAKEVPVGQYSLEFLDKASKDAKFKTTFKDDVLKNVVSFEDNVKSVLTKVVLGEADAGIVYVSDITKEAVEKVSKIDIPDALNVIAEYPIAPVSDSKNLEIAKAFVDLVLSPAGQEIIAKYGLIPAIK